MADDSEKFEEKCLRAEATVEKFLRTQNFTDFEQTGWERKYSTWTRDTIIKKYANIAEFQYIRLMPDFHVFHRDMRCWVDAKAGYCINKEAYEHYMTLDRLVPVYIAVAAGNDGILFVRVSEIIFDADAWRTDTSNPDASGKPYKCIDEFRTTLTPAHDWHPF